MQRHWTVAGLALAALVVSGVGCAQGEAEPEPTGEEVSFASDVQPIFTLKCGLCHIEEEQGGLSLASYEGVLTTGDHTPVVDAGRPDTSFLMIVARSGSMPHDMDKLSQEELDLIADWIAQGAKDN